MFGEAAERGNANVCVFCKVGEGYSDQSSVSIKFLGVWLT